MLKANSGRNLAGPGHGGDCMRRIPPTAAAPSLVDRIVPPRRAALNANAALLRGGRGRIHSQASTSTPSLVEVASKEGRAGKRLADTVTSDAGEGFDVERKRAMLGMNRVRDAHRWYYSAGFHPSNSPGAQDMAPEDVAELPASLLCREVLSPAPFEFCLSPEVVAARISGAKIDSLVKKDPLAEKMKNLTSISAPEKEKRNREQAYELNEEEWGLFEEKQIALCWSPQDEGAAPLGSKASTTNAATTEAAVKEAAYNKPKQRKAPNKKAKKTRTGVHKLGKIDGQRDSKSSKEGTSRKVKKTAVGRRSLELSTDSPKVSKKTPKQGEGTVIKPSLVLPSCVYSENEALTCKSAAKMAIEPITIDQITNKAMTRNSSSLTFSNENHPGAKANELITHCAKKREISGPTSFLPMFQAYDATQGESDEMIDVAACLHLIHENLLSEENNPENPIANQKAQGLDSSGTGQKLGCAKDHSFETSAELVNSPSVHCFTHSSRIGLLDELNIEEDALICELTTTKQEQGDQTVLSPTRFVNDQDGLPDLAIEEPLPPDYEPTALLQCGSFERAEAHTTHMNCEDLELLQGIVDDSDVFIASPVSEQPKKSIKTGQAIMQIKHEIINPHTTMFNDPDFTLSHPGQNLVQSPLMYTDLQGLDFDWATSPVSSSGISAANEKKARATSAPKCCVPSTPSKKSPSKSKISESQIHSSSSDWLYPLDWKSGNHPVFKLLTSGGTPPIAAATPAAVRRGPKTGETSSTLAKEPTLLQSASTIDGSIQDLLETNWAFPPDDVSGGFGVHNTMQDSASAYYSTPAKAKYPNSIEADPQFCSSAQGTFQNLNGKGGIDPIPGLLSETDTHPAVMVMPAAARNGPESANNCTMPATVFDFSDPAPPKISEPCAKHQVQCCTLLAPTHDAPSIPGTPRAPCFSGNLSGVDPSAFSPLGISDALVMTPKSTADVYGMQGGNSEVLLKCLTPSRVLPTSWQLKPLPQAGTTAAEQPKVLPVENWKIGLTGLLARSEPARPPL